MHFTYDLILQSFLATGMRVSDCQLWVSKKGRVSMSHENLWYGKNLLPNNLEPLTEPREEHVRHCLLALIFVRVYIKTTHAKRQKATGLDLPKDQETWLVGYVGSIHLGSAAFSIPRPNRCTCACTILTPNGDETLKPRSAPSVAEARLSHHCGNPWSTQRGAKIRSTVDTKRDVVWFTNHVDKVSITC